MSAAEPVNEYLSGLRDRAEEYGRRAEFHREFLNRWPTPRQCEVRSSSDCCTNRARFVLHWKDWKDKDGAVCSECVAGWLHSLTRHGPVTVERIDD